MSPLVSACPASLLLIGQGSPAPALRLAYLKVGCPAPLPLPLCPLYLPGSLPLGDLAITFAGSYLLNTSQLWGLSTRPGADCCFIMGSFSLRSVFPRAIARCVPHPCPGLSPMPSGAHLPHPRRFWDVSGRSFLLGKFPTISHLGKMSWAQAHRGWWGQGWEAPPPTLEPSRGLQLPRHAWPGVSGLQGLGWGLASVSLWEWGLPNLPTPYSCSQHRAHGLDSRET